MVGLSKVTFVSDEIVEIILPQFESAKYILEEGTYIKLALTG